MTRKIELWTEIHELNDQGEYVPVEHAPRPEVLTGGVFQLRQVNDQIHPLFYFRGSQKIVTVGLGF